MAVLYRLTIDAKRKNKNGQVRLSMPGFKYPVYLRRGTSDVKAFIQVLLYEEYNFSCAVKPHTILDGGANIGMTAVYFANRYPDAKIISVEPDEGNFAMLQKNIAPYPNITAIHGGLWERTTELLIKRGDLGEWNYIVTEAPAGVKGMPAYKINTLMQQYAPSGFDLVKLDIEGSEKTVLAAPDADEWLSKADLFITELHDSMVPGCSASFLQAVSRYPFSIAPHGESLLCLKNAT